MEEQDTPMELWRISGLRECPDIRSVEFRWAGHDITPHEWMIGALGKPYNEFRRFRGVRPEILVLSPLDFARLKYWHRQQLRQMPAAGNESEKLLEGVQIVVTQTASEPTYCLKDPEQEFGWADFQRRASS